MKALSFIRTLHRCMYIQAVWNYKGLLNLGFAQAMVPTVRRLYRDGKERSDLLRRHLGFFLSNPYFAAYAVGACVRLEETAAGTGVPAPEQIESFKRGIGSPLASLGDNLIWGSLRPAFLLIGSALALLGSFWGPVVFLVGYNLPTLAVRSMGLIRGYALGFNLVREVTSPWFNRFTGWLRLLGGFGFGLLAAVVLDHGIDGGPFYGLLAAAVAAVVALGRYLRISYYIILAFCLVVFIGLGYF